MEQLAQLGAWRGWRRGKRRYDDEEKLTTDGDDSLDGVDDGDFESGAGPDPSLRAARGGEQGLRSGGEAGAGRVRVGVARP
jgi:hypothetical protein